MKKLFYMLLLAVVSMTTACTPEEDDLFGESSASRVDAAIIDNMKVLTSAPNGWKMQYFPSSNKTFGGYNMLLKFNENQTVEASSEFFDADFVSTSLFSVKQSAGVVLSMDTYNQAFHIFSDPSDPLGWGGKGQGLGGDYDFLILEASKDKVVLKGKKTNVVSVLTPMPVDVAWEDYLGEIQARDESIVAKKMLLTLGGTEVSVTFNFRNLIFQYMDGEEPQMVKAAFVMGKDGFVLEEPLEILGETIEGFNYNPSTDTFTSYGSVEAEMIIVIPDINQQFVDGDWFISYSNLGKLGRLYFREMKKAIDAVGMVLQYAYIGTSEDGYGFNFMLSGNEGTLNFNYSLVGTDKIALQFAMDGNQIGIICHNNFDFHYALFPFGYGNARLFTITTDDVKNPSYITLTEDADPRNQITLVSDVVLYPFNN